jgi:hypothetical protein
MSNVVKWGAILIGLFVAWRLVSGAVLNASAQVSGLQQTWQPGFYPPQTGGGVVFLSPGLTYGGSNPNWPGGGRGGRSRMPASGPGTRW